MTLLVGVRCVDAVVIGADSAATYATMGQGTVVQATARKIEIVDDRALIAVSGPVGLGQRFTGAFREFLNTKTSRGPSFQVMHELSKKFRPFIEHEFAGASAARPVIGSAAGTAALSHTLVAMVADRQPTLFQFDQQGSPEEATEQLPFVCAGSGQLSADPFMAFVKSVFWEPGQLPTVPEATFAVAWTLQQCIDISPGGVAGPVHLFTLTGDGQKYVAKELEAAELEEHGQAIEAAKAALKGFQRGTMAVPDVPSVESVT